MDADVMPIEMIEALQVVNRSFNEEDVQFAHIALGIADETSQGSLHRNFRLFCVLAALVEKAKKADFLHLRKRFEEYELNNALGMQIKMLQCRSLFYLAEGAKTSGTMTLIEFEKTMLAGQVDFNVANAIVESLEGEGKDCIEFLDFLVYLPVFLTAHDNMMSNPLASVGTERLKAHATGHHSTE